MSFPPKGQADYLALGDWNAVCWECGRKFKASQLVKHWQGYWVCHEHWEPRHPQDFVRPLPDVQTPPWTQPSPAAVFTVFCAPNGMTAIADFAVSDCVICDYVSPMFDASITT